ncbi:phosphoribosylaminoimidazole carboxylase ade2 [Physocladia obscura]|uniref:Adenylosuccinate synthetase n=1 Tax=Physocladia obscura TaxID=109957 RepID=A0AAD5XCD9_9FUNG|nr:phosphoribosylaminoimidazole carboxylase ade2 [Physocladia obscura]
MVGAAIVLGAQWGDEGKGKLVDVLAQKADLCCRAAGGNNAGHTIVANGVPYDFHILPSGLVNDTCISVIGNGVVVHLPSLFSEMDINIKKGLKVDSTRLKLSDRAHLVFDFHQLCDGISEGELGRGSLGTTKKGIGPTYSSKASRSGVRVHHLFRWPEFETLYRNCLDGMQKRYQFEYDAEEELARYKVLAERIRPYVIDTIPYVHKAIEDKKYVLVEGANAIMLDLDFGTYPYVTSSSTGVGGVVTGLGIPPKKIGEVYGVVKAYTTRVGAGPFPTEQLNSVGEYLQTVGHEYGVTTGRKRRCGWLDLVVLKHSHSLNDYTSINLTKLDILDQLPEIKIGVAYLHNGTRYTDFPADLEKLAESTVEYETLPGWLSDISKCKKFSELPVNCQRYVLRVEELIGVRIQWIGVGPGRDAMVEK